MNNRLIIHILRFIGLILLQVLIMDNIRFDYYIHPCVYVLFIMLLPFNIPKWQLLISGFLCGMTVDLFNGTPGLNAAATVLMAFIRPFVINGMTRRKDINPNDEPSLDMGISWFFIYSFILLTAHNFLLFTLEAFSFKLIGIIALQTLISVLSSLMLIFIILLLFKKNKKKII